MWKAETKSTEGKQLNRGEPLTLAAAGQLAVAREKHGSKDAPLQEHRGQSTEMAENNNGREEDGDKRRCRE